MRNVCAGGVVPAPGLLLELAAGFQFRDLAGDLEGQRLAHAADRVHVLDLDLRAEFLLPFRPHGHVAIAAHLALFHVGVADAAVEQDLAQGGQKRERLLRRRDLRLGDDLHQRRPRPVEIDAGVRFVMKALRDVLFQVDADEADLLVRVGDGFLGVLRVSEIVQRHRPALAERQIVLRNLVVLGHVRIEIILPVELADGRDLAAEHQAGERGQFEGMLVHHGQRAGQTEARRAGARVRAEHRIPPPQPQNILLCVLSCTWTSRPMVVRYFIEKRDARCRKNRALPRGALARTGKVVRRCRGFAKRLFSGMIRRFLDPRSDLVFKRIFGEHPDILRSFLNALLPLRGGPIVSLEYLPAELVPAVPLFKSTIVDVRCRDTAGRQFVVEMQMNWTSSFLQRALFNASKAYVTQLGKGEKYDSLLPVIALSLLDDTYTAPDKPWYHHYQIVNVADRDETIEGLELVFVELPKFAGADLSNTPAAQAAWLRFLRETGDLRLETGERTEDEQVVPEIGLALDLAEEGAFSPQERASYEKYWDAVRVERSLVAGHFQKGIEEGLRSALERMVASGISETGARRILGL